MFAPDVVDFVLHVRIPGLTLPAPKAPGLFTVVATARTGFCVFSTRPLGGQMQRHQPL